MDLMGLIGHELRHTIEVLGELSPLTKSTTLNMS